MKNKLLLFTLLIPGLLLMLSTTISFTAAAQNQPQPLPLPRAASYKIMPLGDSLTEGYPELQGGYRPQFWGRLTLDGFVVELVGSLTDAFDWEQPHHEGHSGWKIADLDGQITGWITTYQPDVVLLMIGTNDILNEIPDGMLDRMNTLIGHIFTAKSDTRLIVAQIPPINEATYNQQVEDFNAALPDLISTRALTGQRIGIVDMNSPFSSSDLIDGVHLTQDAYTRMGDLWYAVTSKLLRDPFQQLTPIANQIIHTPLYPFTWTQGEPDEVYKLKLKSADGVYRFKLTNIQPSVCVDGICQVTLDFSSGTPPPEDVVMKWKVSGNAGVKRQTSMQFFQNDFPGKPELLQPVNGAHLTTVTPDFTWSLVPDADRYTLIVDQLNVPAPGDTVGIVNFTFDSTSIPSIDDICDQGADTCTVNLGTLSLALPGNGTYQWRIKAQSPYGVSRSRKFLFTVSTTVTGAAPLNLSGNLSGSGLIPLSGASNIASDNQLKPQK
ncbi:MAG TPA: SGNH/GDSL hydrolase family protein [Phototrophicaceae bacterium]|nr:SGNH/GDSL hydrolase family protein [Phototrophicaceae bacterium]